MPKGNQLGYLPPDVQLALLGGANAAGGMVGFGSGLGQMLAPLLQGAAPAPTSALGSQTQRVVPRLMQSDLDRIGQMDERTLMDTRIRLKKAGLLTPEVDTHFSRRLQAINTRRP